MLLPFGFCGCATAARLTGGEAGSFGADSVPGNTSTQQSQGSYHIFQGSEEIIRIGITLPMPSRSAKQSAPQFKEPLEGLYLDA